MGPSSVATQTVQSAPQNIRWVRTMELGYASSADSADSPRADSAKPICFKCGKAADQHLSGDSGAKILRCSRCSVASYCGRECQVADWKSGQGGGHKHSCAAYKRVGVDLKLNGEDDKTTAREEIFRRIRFYACPYGVYRNRALGRGFLFIQSPMLLAELSLPIPKRPCGRGMAGQRAVLVHFLTLGEYDQELCRDDFELAGCRSQLKEAVESYDEREEIVILMRFRCGHVSVGVSPLVPEYGVCVSLGKDYYEGQKAAEGALQLNLDDV